MTTIQLPELVVPGKRLGRHIRHDPRSLAYLLAETAESAVTSVQWERHIPILNQGQVGACTGNALTGALGTGPLYDALVAELATVPTLDEQFALTVYSDAETLDGDGPYPPNDNGSSGLSVATVAKSDGYVSGYQHATSVAAAHTALAAGPFITGTYWYSDMDDPTGEGIVEAGGTIRGGHEYLCRQYDAARDLWWFDNSWGTSFGVAGRFAYDTPTFTKLLSKVGDVTALVPLTAPAPTPTPPATPLAAFLEVAQPWVAMSHTSKPNHDMQLATKAYLASLAAASTEHTRAAARHYHDAATGRYVSEDYASRNESTTYGSSE